MPYLTHTTTYPCPLLELKFFWENTTVDANRSEQFFQASSRVDSWYQFYDFGVFGLDFLLYRPFGFRRKNSENSKSKNLVFEFSRETFTRTGRYAPKSSPKTAVVGRLSALKCTSIIYHSGKSRITLKGIEHKRARTEHKRMPRVRVQNFNWRCRWNRP